MKKPKAVFFDKDGTLIKDVPYNVNPDLIELIPGARKLTKQLKQQGFKVVIISNQSGVARGMFKESDLLGVIDKLTELLGEFDGFYYCPHHPKGTIPEYSIDCNCRKPAPGLIHKAAEDLVIDLENSWMVGDILKDAEAGKAAGCKTILVDHGGETEWKVTPNNQPDFICQNFNEVSDTILPSNKRKQSKQLRTGVYHAT